MKLHTLFIGHPIKILEEVNSTNSYALELIQELPPIEGCVIWAKYQLEGRGQRGTTWISEPYANLTFSIVLQPHFLPIAEQFQLTKAIALGIAAFVSHRLEDNSNVKIKWPNDIYVKNCKIAGVLIENVLEQSVIRYSVVGIGLNLNQVVFDLSIPNPVSLKILTGKAFDPEDCLKLLCSFIEKQYLDLRAGKYQQIDEAYFNLLYRRGIWSDYMLSGNKIIADIVGINSSGHLVLKEKNNLNNPCENIVVKDSKQLLFL
jgi:BirA family transcriptional regulator, biotin operon repressor / biotin---[acetyl-CoA-carboxylase] ligase